MEKAAEVSWIRVGSTQLACPQGANDERERSREGEERAVTNESHSLKVLGAQTCRYPSLWPCRRGRYCSERAIGCRLRGFG